VDPPDRCSIPLRGTKLGVLGLWGQAQTGIKEVINECGDDSDGRCPVSRCFVLSAAHLVSIFLVRTTVLSQGQVVVDFNPLWWTSAWTCFFEPVTAENCLRNQRGYFMTMLAHPLLIGETTTRDRPQGMNAVTLQPKSIIKEDDMTQFKSGFFVGGEACNGRVLVVDDEPDIRKVVRMTLQKAGYEVIEAENGEKAIEAINEGENRLLLDVVICDIRMPKINGAEAIAYFRSNYPRVPLIVLTGFPDTDMATSFLRQGVMDYLVKPVEGEKLKEAVRRAMEERELAKL
jgi:CheY-like chemotaxis protein